MPEKDLQKGALRVNAGKGSKDRVVPVDRETLGWLQVWSEKRKALGLNGKDALLAGLREGAPGAANGSTGRASPPATCRTLWAPSGQCRCASCALAMLCPSC